MARTERHSAAPTGAAEATARPPRIARACHYCAETLNRPRPIGRPQPVILIRGNGERMTLRPVAKYADACTIHVLVVNEIGWKLEVLRRHCDRKGATSTTSGSPSKVDDWTRLTIRTGFLRRAEQLAAFGVRHIDVRAAQPDRVGFVANVTDSVLRRLASIQPSRQFWRQVR